MPTDDAGPADPGPPDPAAPVGPAHQRSIGLPHSAATEGPIAEAEAAAARIATEDAPLGQKGRPLPWRAPFFVGLTATAGVAVTYGLIQLVLGTGSVLVLIGLALFLAIGLEPAVSWLVRHRVPRWASVTMVLLVILAALAGFLAAAVPALVEQGTQLAKNVPTYLQQLKNHSSFLGRLNDRFDLENRFKSLVSSSGTSILDGVLGAGKVIFTALSSTLIVMVLTAYFLADLPRIRALLYRLVPASRRPRAVLIGDDILAKVGGYVLGNLVVSAVSGILTFGWLMIFGVPYAFLLSIMVALLDLVPVIGSTVGGAVVALVALTVSVPVALATVGFFVLYRLAEDYLLIPRIIGRAVQVPALVTVVAVLIGGALLGVVGALVAIPVAAALLLLARELLFPRLDQS